MKEHMSLAQDDCRKVFRELLQVYEPERLLLGEVGFLSWIADTPNITTYGEDVWRLSLYFEGESVFYATITSHGKSYLTLPRMHQPIEQAVTHWKRMLQERL